ncbi:MAG: hypothetical protein ACXVB9_16395 [Bdellovibrionota bacterium]
MVRLRRRQAAGPVSYADDSASLAELRRELAQLREHNRAGGDGSLWIAEAALALITLERFLRILPGVNAADKESLPQLLQRAIDRRFLALPVEAGKDTIDRVRKLRNAILHGNYEQAAKQAGLDSAAAYFLLRLQPELEFLFGLTNHLISQVDEKSGIRKS